MNELTICSVEDEEARISISFPHDSRKEIQRRAILVSFCTAKLPFKQHRMSNLLECRELGQMSILRSSGKTALGVLCAREVKVQ